MRHSLQQHTLKLERETMLLVFLSLGYHINIFSRSIHFPALQLNMKPKKAIKIYLLIIYPIFVFKYINIKMTQITQEWLQPQHWGGRAGGAL